MGQDRMRPGVPQQPEPGLVHQPFRVLSELAVKPSEAQLAGNRPAVATARVAGDQPVDGAALFLSEVADVVPLEARARERVSGRAPAVGERAVTHPDAEALAELCDLVTGSAPFDIRDSDEYIEGAALGTDPRLLRRLQAGEFAYQAHLDLHGMFSNEARAAVEAFLARAYRTGKRCVLIVHGRGRNSKDQIPVLKSRLTTWLARGQWARLVLAFASARPCDGGVGALYLLLRRRRVKRAIRVTLGAKW
jgi:DNA-nicking Smr family endonuclease